MIGLQNIGVDSHRCNLVPHQLRYPELLARQYAHESPWHALKPCCTQSRFKPWLHKLDPSSTKESCLDRHPCILHPTTIQELQQLHAHLPAQGPVVEPGAQPNVPP